MATLPENRAAEIMTIEVIYMEPDDHVSTAWDFMKEYSFRHIPIVENFQLRGIISDRDILRHTGSATKLPNLPLEQIMTKDPISVTEDCPLDQICTLMLEEKINCLPIVGTGGTLSGLITSSDLIDLLRYLVSQMSDDALPTYQYDIKPYSQYEESQLY